MEEVCASPKYASASGSFHKKATVALTATAYLSDVGMTSGVHQGRTRGTAGTRYWPWFIDG